MSSDLDAFRRLASAEVLDEYALNTAAGLLAEDSAALAELVAEYAASDRKELQVAPLFPLMKCWYTDGDPNDFAPSAIKYIELAGGSDGQGLLTGALSTLEAMISTDRTLLPPDRYQLVANFTYRCLRYPHLVVQASAVEFLSTLAELDLLDGVASASDDADLLREGLRSFFSETGSDFAVEAEHLADFLRS